MRWAPLLLLLALSLSGCSSPSCQYEVRWNDPSLVDRLTPMDSDGFIPLDAQGLAPELQGATLGSVVWSGPGGEQVESYLRFVSVVTPADADPTTAFDGVRLLLQTFTDASEAQVDAVVSDLRANHTTWLNEVGQVQTSGRQEHYEATFQATWNVRGVLDTHFDMVPLERTLLVNDFRLHILPRSGTGEDPLWDLYADSFGAARYGIRTSPNQPHDDETLRQQTKDALEAEGFKVPEDAQVVYLGGQCGEPDPETRAPYP